MNRNRQHHLQTAAIGLVLAALAAAPGAAAVEASPPGAGDTVDRLVESLEGGWAGNENDTPFGKMGFAALFEWQEDGSLLAHSPLNSETWIDLRFARDEAGRWILHEEAAMEGLGVQKYSLAPSDDLTDDGLHRWIWEEDPDYLAIDVGVRDETMLMNVTLRGKPHIAFRLDRLPREDWAEMKQAMIAQDRLSPEEGTSIVDVVSSPPASLAGLGAELDPIDQARQTVAADPESAEARVALAMTLGEAINADPANGPRFAFEMLGSLEKAIELDPTLPAAYHGLVGYYLNAPPIAGGSVEKAEETARKLAELDPEAGNALLTQIAARAEAPAGGH